MPVNLEKEAMRGEEYLTKPQQYALVYSKGSSWASNLVVVKALPNGLTLSRYGFSVSKRVGKAVTRNRAKRWLREILRIMPLKSAWDIIFIVRPAAASADYAGFKRAVENLLLRASLLETEEENRFLVGVNAGGERESAV